MLDNEYHNARRDDNPHDDEPISDVTSIAPDELNLLTDRITNAIELAIRKQTCSSYNQWQELILSILKSHYAEKLPPKIFSEGHDG
jgi:hypothetical protein